MWPLDQVSAGALSACGLRRLRSAYTGPAVRVRRSSDNAEADIGFAGNDLDTAALLRFGGENRFLYSDAFSAVWSVYQLSRVAGSTDPFGGTAACSFAEVATGGATEHYFDVSPPLGAQTYTASVYVRSNGTTTGFRMNVYHAGETLGSSTSDWSIAADGTVSNASFNNRITAVTATAAANGYWRVSVTWSITAACTSHIYRIYPTAQGGVYVGDPTKSAEFFGAQLCIGNSVKGYASSAGVISDGNTYVRTFYDQSGNGQNVAQSTAAAQPQIIAAGVPVSTASGKPAVQFSGNRYLTLSTTSLNGDHSVAFVYAAGSGNNAAGSVNNWSAGNGLLGADATGTAADFGYGIYNGVLVGGSGNPDLSAPGRTAVNNGTQNIVVWTRSNNTGEIYTYNSGVLEANRNLNSGTRSAVTSVALGSMSPVGAGYFSGTISECLLFASSLSKRDIGALTAEQAENYAISAAVIPSDERGAATPVTSLAAHLTSRAPTFYDTFESPPVFAVSTRRLRQNIGNPVLTSPYGTSVYFSESGVWDAGILPSDPGYDASDGVTALTWYDQSGNNRHLSTTDPMTGCVVTQGMSQGPALITGVGTRPGFFIGNTCRLSNPLSGDFTLICLLRTAIGGGSITSANWRTASMGTLCDVRVGAANDDMCIGIGSSTLYVGTGQSGGADVFLAGTVPIVNGLYADPKLVTVRRTQVTGRVELRVNRAPDAEAFMTTGPLSTPGLLNLYPNGYVAEMMIFNRALSAAAIQQAETEIALYYGLP